jgi:hypothetical protein
MEISYRKIPIFKNYFKKKKKTVGNLMRERAGEGYQVDGTLNPFLL